MDAVIGLAAVQDGAKGYSQSQLQDSTVRHQACRCDLIRSTPPLAKKRFQP